MFSGYPSKVSRKWRIVALRDCAGQFIVSPATRDRTSRGLALMAYPYFIEDAVTLCAIGLAGSAALFWLCD